MMLQEKNKGANPVLIRIETNAGHGAGTALSKSVEQAADIYSFIFSLFAFFFDLLSKVYYSLNMCKKAKFHLTL